MEIEKKNRSENSASIQKESNKKIQIKKCRCICKSLCLSGVKICRPLHAMNFRDHLSHPRMNIHKHFSIFITVKLTNIGGGILALY